MCEEFDRAVECWKQANLERAISGLFETWNNLPTHVLEYLQNNAPELEAAIARVDDCNAESD